eukprot:3087374-Alexandrium_andersonii.AAC.1
MLRPCLGLRCRSLRRLSPQLHLLLSAAVPAVVRVSRRRPCCSSGGAPICSRRASAAASAAARMA